ncbi:hypothetical protein Calkro_1764 [Caldicellulosiruptor kronotskyensis 2002]|uniref:Lipoprotein n=2 Tax=Caldicellulosiruptor TaxID=44000 RepID=A0A3T0D4I8_9FIRM|nr:MULTISPECIES: hypothetical protein [Caldicellulosiruptor]ADQ46613.1 hypothetical protein Calkro_1764 [Caldicellulosiruptor kronotskyensis 2002]AZT89959.1 hypothetical protein ELD05_04435 [Caldicellulosiruptor changbaiensis]
MRRKVIILVLVCTFIFAGCAGIGCAIYRGKAGTGKGVDAGAQKVVLASEQAEREGNITDVNQDNQNLTENQQKEDVDTAVYSDPTDRFTDKRIKELYGIILVSSSALADFYYSDSWKRTSKDIAEHPEKYSELYILEWKSREELAMEAIKVYEGLLKELRENPQNWREVWKRYKEFTLDIRPKLLNVQYDWKIKEKWFFNTEEGKIHAKRNDIDRGDVEQWKKDYEIMLEKSRKETEESLKSFAEEAGIEY